ECLDCAVCRFWASQHLQYLIHAPPPSPAEGASGRAPHYRIRVSKIPDRGVEGAIGRGRRQALEGGGPDLCVLIVERLRCQLGGLGRRSETQLLHGGTSNPLI